MQKIATQCCHEYVEADGRIVMFADATSYYFGGLPIEVVRPDQRGIRIIGEYRGWSREQIRELVYSMRDLPAGHVPDGIAQNIRDLVRVAPWPDHITPDWHPQSSEVAAQNSPLRALSDAAVAACAARIDRLHAMYDRDDYRHRGQGPWNTSIKAAIDAEWETAARLTGLKGDYVYRAIEWHWREES